MSLQVNTELLERAAQMIDYWTDKLPAQLIEADLDRNDLDALYYHVCAAEGLASQQEYNYADTY